MPKARLRLDSASNTVLKIIDKQLSLGAVRDGLRYCREAGIETELEMIVGMPGEGWKEFEESHDFVAALVGEGLVSHLNVNRYFVLPASRFGAHPSVTASRWSICPTPTGGRPNGRGRRLKHSSSPAVWNTCQCAWTRSATLSPADGRRIRSPRTI
jgi:hypothetical protein